MDFYVNNQKVATATNDAYPHGQIALDAWDIQNETDVAFTDLKVWTL